LGRQVIAGDGRELLEALRILDRHVREHLAVEADAGQAQPVHELAVAQVRQSGRCIDAHDPDPAHHPLLHPPVAIGKGQGSGQRFLRLLKGLAAAAVVPLGLLEDLVPPAAGRLSSFHPGHLVFPFFPVV
jgi:hypothetical protein